MPIRTSPRYRGTPRGAAPCWRDEELRCRLRLVGIVEVQPLGAGAALDGAEDVARVGETEFLGRPVGGVVGHPGLQARDGPLAFGVTIVHGGTPTA